jgi:hypothetical protein
LFLALAPIASASSTWYVDGVNGSDSNNCKTRLHACKTIGHAISLASSGDSIMVAAATYTENLTIPLSLNVIGSSAKTTIIDGGGNGSVVTIPNTGTKVTFSKLTIQNGFARGPGGGIYNGGALRINNTTISGNSAFTGGGIYNRGTVTISSSTISGNRAYKEGCQDECFTRGGGIYNGGTMTISNSTISRNGASSNCRIACSAEGGGIDNNSRLTISNSTIDGNGAVMGGGIAGNTILQNSIVANNPGGNCYAVMTSKGYNLSSDNTCDFNGSGDLNNTDPKLGQLGNHGGTTQTIPLLSGSPAIDAGNPSGCTDGHGHLLKTDQRGFPRPDKEDTGGCDMGAYERQAD